MRGRKRAVGAIVAGVVALGCSPNPCGNSTDVVAVGLDVSGQSNVACTVTVTDGETTLSYDVPAPTPAVADAPGDSPATPLACFVVGESSRSPTQLCFAGDTSLDELAHARNTAGCPLRVSLTCGGTLLYDAVPWNFCRLQC